MVQNRKIIIIIAITLLLGLIFVFFTVNKLSRSGKEMVKIEYAPSLMKLSINGKKVSGSEHYLKNGDYIISIEHPDFKKQEVKINVPKDKNVFFFSVPTTDKGLKLIENNPKYTREMEQINGSYANNNTNKMLTKYPFLNSLPIESFGLYKIGYGKPTAYNKNGSHAIYVTAYSPQDRQMALKTITQKLTNPSEIEIIFSNSYNPFRQQ